MVLCEEMNSGKIKRDDESIVGAIQMFLSLHLCTIIYEIITTISDESVPVDNYYEFIIGPHNISRQLSMDF